MAISDSLGQLAATLSSMVRTRLELAAVELEEEFAHFSSSLIWSLLALFFACLTILLIILTVVAVFWDTQYRYTVLLVLIAVFGVLAAGIGLRVRNQFRNKPGLLFHSLAELKKDASVFNRSDVNQKEQG
ncbi:phage holin family protein [Undibacterium sp. TC4M20W]|uniref:phage holin family protein n=1 Tax=Undibacterium sp. TC4M20W TaxID=3413052 RepID=UPI003BF15882